MQVQCSLLAPADDQLLEVIAVSRDLGVEVLAYSPLAFGVLGYAPGAEVKLPATWLRRRLFRRLLPASFELRSEMQAIAIERGASMVQVAVNWCRAQGTTPIPDCELRLGPGMSPLLQWSMSCRSVSGWTRLGAVAANGCPLTPSRVAEGDVQASEAVSGAGLTTTGRLSLSVRIGTTLSCFGGSRGAGGAEASCC